MKQSPKLTTLGGRLKWLREKHELTLAEFGKRIGVGRSYLSKLENGKSENVSTQFLNSVCQQFDVWDTWLVNGEGEAFRYGHLNELAEQGPLRLNRQSHPHEKRAVFTDALVHAGDYLAFNFTIDRVAEALARILVNRQFDAPLRLEVARILASELAAQIALHANEPDSIVAAKISEPISDLGNFAKAAAHSYEAVQLGNVQLQNAALKRNDLTATSNPAIDEGVQDKWPALKQRLQKAAADAKSRSKLIKFLGVDTTRISQWLTDSKNAREPGAEYALKMLHWVEQQERQSK